MKVIDRRGRIGEAAITGVVGAIMGFFTDRLLIWATDLTLVQTVLLGCATAAGSGAGVLEFLARRRAGTVPVRLPTVSNTKVQALSQPPHEQDGSDPNVRFWHSIADRERNGKDVRALVKEAQHRVIITGIELHYIVKYCAHDLKTALSSGTLIGIVISKAVPRNIAFYLRYSRDVDKTMAVTHEMYTALAKSLDPRQQECFALYHTDIPLTHSIGLYDDTVFVSEFCIDCASSVCPSFSPPRGSKTHTLFISELKALLKESVCTHGSGHARLVRSL